MNPAFDRVFLTRHRSTDLYDKFQWEPHDLKLVTEIEFIYWISAIAWE